MVAVVRGSRTPIKLSVHRPLPLVSDGEHVVGSHEVVNPVAATGAVIIVEAMRTESPVLQGKHVRLEPLEHRHVEGLVTASAADPSLYQWSPVPQGKVEAAKYVDTALAWRDAGSAVPFATVRVADG